VIDPLAEVTAIEVNEGVELGEVVGENAMLPQPASKNRLVNKRYSERRVRIMNGS